jgi:hypothetical protein
MTRQPRHPPPPSTMTTQLLVGVLELASKYRYGLTSRGAPMYLFQPYDETWPALVVGSSERDISRNQIAVVEATQNAKEKDRATLIRLLGPVGTYAAEFAGLLQHYCPERQPRIFTEADTSLDSQRIELDAANGWTVFHVDPPGCRDIDDAIAFHAETGKVAITIADAAAHVSPGSTADTIAFSIGATFYDANGSVVRPMLPPSISEESASLLPGTRRRGVTLILNADGTLDRWVLSWITVAESYTYENFMTSRTAAALKAPATMDPHDWIAAHMIRYNAAAALLLRDVKQGVLRVQPETTDTLSALHTIDPALAHEAATYEVPNPDAANQRHASLNLPAYCHASSPLRRYADLLNQRVLKSILSGSGTPQTEPINTTHLNDRTKANRRWTRDLTFLDHVTPGQVHEIDVVWVSANQVWVPAWKRLLRTRHEESHAIGEPGRIQIFCDPTRRNWKRRVLTAPAAADV